MGLLDRLKKGTRGVFTSVKQAGGAAPAPADEVKRRLLAISGKGITTGEDDGEIVVAWAARIAGAGLGGGEYENLYRAIRVSLDSSENTASGICFKTSTDAELGPGSLSASKSWERGQHVGVETVHVLAWLGPHMTEGGADEQGYKFSWSQLRDPVIEAVTGAGWTYKPKSM